MPANQPAPFRAKNHRTTAEKSQHANALADLGIYLHLMSRDAESACGFAHELAALVEQGGDARPLVDELRRRCARIAQGLRTIDASKYLHAELSPLLKDQAQ